MKWHPDKYDGDDKKTAEKMFIDIAAAKEVLTDPGRLYQLKRHAYQTPSFHANPLARSPGQVILDSEK